jgi:sugar phosphate isomerase/epimerase
MNRRHFLTGALAAPLAARPAKGAKPVLSIFSKHMANLNYDQLGRTAKQMGFDGVDLTVRKGGHVAPERAAEDLPKATEIIRGHGLELAMITTGLISAQDATAKPILATAGRLKIPYWKLGYWRYDLKDVEGTVVKTKKATAELVALGREHGVVAGFHNHSADYVGSTVWDIREIIRDLDPKWAGYYFDPGHATIEGGLAGWRISQGIVTPRLKMVALKDFYWSKNNDGSWTVTWCPMGQGMVNWREVFAHFARTGFSGPMSLHVEYDPPDEPAAIAKDLEFMKKMVAQAYTS